MAILIEHYGGEFPLWLSPVQAKILPIADSHAAYADEVRARLQSAGIRVEVDYRAEKIGLKIRDAEKQKAPYMLVVGDQEMVNRSLAVRKRKEGNQGVMSFEKVVDGLLEEMAKGRK